MSELYLLCCWLNILGFYILAFVPNLTSYIYNFVCVFVTGSNRTETRSKPSTSFSDTYSYIFLTSMLMRDDGAVSG